MCDNLKTPSLVVECKLKDLEYAVNLMCTKGYVFAYRVFAIEALEAELRLRNIKTFYLEVWENSRLTWSADEDYNPKTTYGTKIPVVTLKALKTMRALGIVD